MSRVRFARIILSATVVLIAALVLAGCGLGDLEEASDEAADDAPRPATAEDSDADDDEAAPEAPEAGDDAAYEFDGNRYRVGDCFSYATADVGERMPGEVMACGEPHDGEVFAVDTSYDSQDPGIRWETELGDYVGVPESEVQGWCMDHGLDVNVAVTFTAGDTGSAMYYLASPAEGQPLTQSYRAD